MSITVREAKKEDVKAIYKLIKALAIYEEAPNEVTVTPQILEEDGFGSTPIYKAFVAETSESNIVGFALYYTKYSTWKGRCIYLEDLYVEPEYRKFGIGEKLFLSVAKVAKNSGFGRMEWQVLYWNTPALSFYRKHGAQLDNDWVNGKFTFDQLQKMTF
jgi:GNAT superfamily N-acetyltransferase